jgi:two-component system sensor histidine kinase KdpD
MLFLAAVVGAATLWGLAIAIYAAALSFLSWNFFFIPPVYRLTIREPRDVIAIIVFAGVAVATGWLASRLRRTADAAQGRIESLRRITAFSRRLDAPATEADLLTEIAKLAADIASPAVVLTAEGEDLNIRASAPAMLDTMDDGSWAAARWAYAKQEQAGRGTATLPSSAWRFVPMVTLRGHLGIVGLRPDGPLDQPEAQALLALADQAASALERVRLAASAARTEAQAETQKLRTALLNSLSHDLRTPLTSIRGAAGSLRTAWDTLPAPARADLLASIEEDTVRMTRFLSNIMDMTRLETGEIVPRLESVMLANLVDEALARVSGLGQVAIDLPTDLPAVCADPALLEQVLVNLLENAAKYGPDGGLVRISATASAGHLRISIADEGPGISAEDLPHVFDSFYRARRGDRVVPGTGLGLAIARGLTESMGGSIEARSPRPDLPRNGAPGTRVDLILPMVTLS